MFEGLKSKILGIPQPGENIWDWVLKHDDDKPISMKVITSDGEIIADGTIRPGDVRETLANPDYQEMMRRCAARAFEIRAEREAIQPPPITEI